MSKNLKDHLAGMVESDLLKAEVQVVEFQQVIAKVHELLID